MVKSETPRMRKVNSIMHHVLAEAIENLKDPRLNMVTITGVDTAPDLRKATVFVSTVDLASSSDALVGLDHAGRRLRRIVGEAVRLKFVPELSFALDPAIVGGERIDALLRELSGDQDG